MSDFCQSKFISVLEQSIVGWGEKIKKMRTRSRGGSFQKFYFEGKEREHKLQGEKMLMWNCCYDRYPKALYKIMVRHKGKNKMIMTPQQPSISAQGSEATSCCSFWRHCKFSLNCLKSLQTFDNNWITRTTVKTNVCRNRYV